MEPQPGWFKRRLAAALASNALPTFLVLWLHRRLARDHALGAAYDALRQAERAAAGGAALTASQSELLESLVLSAAGTERRARAPFAAMGAAMGAAALFVWFGGAPGLPTLSGPLVERGASGDPLGVTVTCIDKATKSVTGLATVGARTPAAPLACAHGALLAFSTTNLGASGKHLFVVGIGEDGDRRWYAPFSTGGPTIPLPPGTAGVALPVAADTSGMTLEPRTSLHVLFFDAPREGSDVERILAAAAARGTTLRALERLPVDATAQARIDVSWRSGGE